MMRRPLKTRKRSDDLMDAIFGLLFLLYMVAVAIAAVSKGRQGKTRGAGAPWPRIPPLEAPGTGTGAGVPASPAVGPVASEAEDDMTVQPGRALEARPEPPASEGSAATHPVYQRAPEETRGRGTRRRSPEEWFSEEGLSLEWAGAGAWGTGRGPGRLSASSKRRVSASTEDRRGRRDLPETRAATDIIGELGPEELVRAMVLAEVLGPPRALRRRIRL